MQCVCMRSRRPRVRPLDDIRVVVLADARVLAGALRLAGVGEVREGVEGVVKRREQLFARRAGAAHPYGSRCAVAAARREGAGLADAAERGGTEGALDRCHRRHMGGGGASREVARAATRRRVAAAAVR